jgi:hypothetical protein
MVFKRVVQEMRIDLVLKLLELASLIKVLDVVVVDQRGICPAMLSSCMCDSPSSS